MTMKTMKLALAAVAVLGVGAVSAQEFGEKKNATPSGEQQEFVQSKDGAMAQDQALVEFKEGQKEDPPASKLLGDMLRNNEMTRYDPKTGRIVAQRTVWFNVRNPKISTDFITERTTRMVQLLMQAKAEIVLTMYSKMSAEQVLNEPDHPVAKKLDDDQKFLRKQLEETKKMLEEAGVALDDAKRDVKAMTSPQLMAALADIFKSDYAAKLQGEKKAEYEAAKNDFKAAEKEYQILLKRVDEENKKMGDNLQQELKQRMSLYSKKQIHGCKVLQQAESAKPVGGKWRYEISALFSWSPEDEAAAKAILSAKSVKFQKGKHTVEEWLDHYSKIDPKKGGLADWMGPRTYIDKNGDMWYLGIYPSPVLEDAFYDSKGVKSAAMKARAEVGFALYADLVVSNTFESLNLQYDVDGESVTKTLDSYSQHISQSFSNLEIHGLRQVGGDFTLKHATGHDIHVVVYGVNASEAQTMKSIHENTQKVALEINTIQEKMRGKNARMRQQVLLSRDNEAAREAGAREADQETADAFKARAAEERKRQIQESAPVPAPQQRQELRRGTRFTPANDDF